MDDMTLDERRLLNAEGNRVVKNLYTALDEFILYSAHSHEFKKDTLTQMVDRMLPEKSEEEWKLDMKRQVLQLRAKEIKEKFSRMSEEGKQIALAEILKGGLDEKAK